MEKLNCRSCGTELIQVLVDLGISPLSNSYLSKEQLNKPEPKYPLEVKVCDTCHLAQLPSFEAPADIFRDYLYYSSFSETWLRHAERYVDNITESLSLGPNSLVMEVASNDGYLLQYFHRHQVPVLGIEPALGPAAEAEKKGIRTEKKFFGIETAKKIREKEGTADLMIANNVMAHVPDINDFVAGFKILLATNGSLTIEFPSLLQLIENNQFDTIYHEHFSYLCLTSALNALLRHGLDVYNVEEMPTHGGSLRVYVCHKGAFPREMSVTNLLAEEKRLGLGKREYYEAFAKKTGDIRTELLAELNQYRKRGRKVAAYGAPAKGNTLLNYCGIGRDQIDFTVDANPHKQGMYLPGSRIPIFAPSKLQEARPDVILILPWNLRDEILKQLQPCREWGAQFLVTVPRLEIL